MKLMYSSIIETGWLPNVTIMEEWRIMPNIKLVNFNEKKGVTTIKWSDNTITQVRVQTDLGDTYNPEMGMAMCIAKKALGNKGNFNEVFKKWLMRKDNNES